MAEPNFYLIQKDTADNLQTIIMHWNFNGHKLKYYTSFRIDPKFYRSIDSTGKKIKRDDVNKLISASAPQAKYLKECLKNLALDAKNIVAAAKVNKIVFSKEYVTAELDLIHKPKVIEIPADKRTVYTFVTYFEKMIADSKAGIRVIKTKKNEGKEFTKNSIKNYGTSLSAIRRYLKYKRLRKIEFDSINMDFYTDFRYFIYKVEKKEVSTFGTYIKDIMVVMDEANDAGLQISNGHKSRHFIIPAYESDNKAFTLTELDIIHNHVFVNERKDRIRDLFLIGCYTALRFGNFNNLKVENIENGFLRLRQIKTGNLVTIPVIDRLKSILDKYHGQLPFPVSNQEFNRVIKDVIKECGIDYMVTIKSTPGNVVTQTEIEIYNVITSHTARRSFCTILFKMGIPVLLIMSASGHKTESSFFKYIKLTNEDKAIMMVEAMKQRGLIAA